MAVFLGAAARSAFSHRLTVHFETVYLTNNACVFVSVLWPQLEKELLGDLKTSRKKGTDEKARQHLGTWWGREGRRLQLWEMISILATGTDWFLRLHITRVLFCVLEDTWLRSFKRNTMVDNVRMGQALWFETVEQFTFNPGL